MVENDPIKDMVTEEVSKWSAWEAVKFIGIATVLSPGLVLEAGKDYLINKIQEHQSPKDR